jgi:nickel/cobalt transporter (NicO) family protein
MCRGGEAVEQSLIVLMGTAVTVGVVHTLLGPDHYLPFVVLSKARSWTPRKTALITALCGLGHVLGSVVLGLAGIAVGVALFRLEALEAVRGDIAAWLLMAFGFAYFVWGIRRAILNRPHTHSHTHLGGLVHSHDHSHTGDHAHVHGDEKGSVTPWVLFIVFVLGPCEPLIPILMFPASRGSMSAAALVASVFAVATIGTMLGVVMSFYHGLARIRVGRLERYGHAAAGLAILLSGGAITFLGL